MHREEAGELADWGMHEENTARLLDVLSAGLGYDYASWTSDPEEMAAEQRRRRKAGIKPPPNPVIPPVASRPGVIASRLIDEHVAMLEQYQLLPKKPERRMVSSDEFDRLNGL